ncbi:MAG: hypothetical protein RRY23_05535 [Alistipes sp.]
MKTNLLLLGLMCGTLSLVGCQKDIDDTTDQTTNLISRTGMISDTPWEEGGSRTIYDETGIHLKGDEAMSVYYGDAAQAITQPLNNKPDNPVTAKITVDKYSFTHAAIAGAAAYNYYFLLPDVGTNGKNTKGDAISGILTSVQNPTAATFDSDNDYLVGKPIENVPAAKTELLKTDLQFKRLFAHLKITIADAGKLLKGESIYAVRLTPSGAAVKKNPLTGFFYAKIFSSVFSECAVGSWGNGAKTGFGNTLMADYPSGMAPKGTDYTVWFLVNPITLTAGDMKLEITTATQTLTRTIALPKITILSNKINKLSLSTAGGTSEKTFVQSFATETKGSDVVATTTPVTVSLTASDGTASDWIFGASTGKIAYIKNGRQSAPQFGLSLEPSSATTITLPQIAGKTITKIVFVQAPNNARNPNNDFTLKAGATSISCNFDGYALMTSGGCLTVDIPAAEQGKSLVIEHASTNTRRTVLESMILYYK